ncbi:MAG: hypothetical protein ACTSQF_11175 [Candidatus Heimdallarchaeaceae archaeon]
MIVSKSKNFLLQAVSIFLLISCLMNYQEIKYSANAAEVIIDGTGGLLPMNDTNLQMIEANILFLVDETFGEKGQFRIIFDGNYTIYNPNDTIETMIGAPFISVHEIIGDLIKLEVENTELEYDIVYSYDDNFNFTPWEEYFEDYYSFWSFAISNITFSGYSNTTIRCSFDIISHNLGDNLYNIMYNVGTAAAWNGNITETVTFSINGNQPHDFDCYSFNETHWVNKEPIIRETEDGFEYSWIWNNERIKEKTIEISYRSSDITNEGLTISLLSIVIVAILYRRKRVSKKSI